ncbi:aminotransferase class V-fold PLP-dependent enzyme, partial [Flavobacteriaceae bacterium]|nr:aminotransferase class V-fold PLP-dependent enzyme [Flavobacteriaceae bacterium]
MSTEIFPLLTKSTYLNTAYVGPMSKDLAVFRNKHEYEYVQNGGDYKIKAYASLEETHHVLAKFFGSNPINTFVIPNFSIGIRNAISLLPKKLNILLFQEEYPSLAKAFEEGDFNIHKIPMQPEIEVAIEKRLAKGDIDILALSVVQYASGLFIDIEFIKDLKERYPNLIIVGDGTQFLGAHHFNFDTSPFDVVAASGYKWLLAGFGNGVLMISEAYIDMIQKKPLVLFNLVFNGHFNILATASLRFAIKA